MTNVIKQIVKGSGDSQSIKMIVKDNERGPQGEQGEPGAAATITAGQAYTVTPDSNPVVMNTGTPNAAVFDFYIPKGEKGNPGSDGKDGKDGKDGAIQYTAGTGIQITSENVINATGAAVATWGGIQGVLSNQTDLQDALNAKQGELVAGANISISAQNEISAVDTTYSNFAGTDGSTDGAAGLVPAPANTDAGKYLNADGTWGTISIPTVNDATLTIQQNGSDVATFTANSSTSTTANITSPIITTTAADPGEGAPLSPNNYIAVYGGGAITMDYSTVEIDTGAKWIDGTAIYKKSVYISSLPDAGNSTYAASISNLSKVVKIEGIYYNGSGTFFPANMERPNETLGIGTYFENGNICIYTGTTDRSAYSGYVTLYYTKSS